MLMKLKKPEAVGHWEAHPLGNRSLQERKGIVEGLGLWPQEEEPMRMLVGKGNFADPEGCNLR